MVPSWHLCGQTDKTQKKKKKTQDRQSPGQNLNPRPPEYEVGMLPS
jgi:hypothetical protein